MKNKIYREHAQSCWPGELPPELHIKPYVNVSAQVAVGTSVARCPHTDPYIAYGSKGLDVKPLAREWVDYLTWRKVVIDHPAEP